MEKYLLESFERFGPQATIEDQLTKVMFEHRQKLCVPYCGSIEEYISTYAKKVGLQHYGVETRLWYKDQDVPAFGKWNITEYRAHAKSVSAFPLKDFLLAAVPDYVMDEYVADGFFTRSKNIVSDVIDSLCQGEVTLDDEDISALSLNLKGRGDIISPAYNWFSDQVLGPVRHKALALFGKINMLVTKADYYGAGAETPFQQDLVIQAVHMGIGMMMRHQPGNSLRHISFNRHVCKETLYQRRAFQLLVFSIGIAIFLPAQRAGNIMHHRRQLQRQLRLTIQPLLLSNGFSKRPYLEKMVDIVQVALIKGDHLFNCG